MDAGGGTLRVPPPTSTVFPQRTPHNDEIQSLPFGRGTAALNKAGKCSGTTRAFMGAGESDLGPRGTPPQTYNGIRPAAHPSMPPYGGRGVGLVCREALVPFR